MMTSKKSAATLGTALVAARAQAHDLQDRVGPTVAEARERLAPAVADAKERIAPKVADARGRITPVVVDARGRINPVVVDAKVRLSDLADAVSSKLDEAEAAASVEKKAAKQASKKAGDKASKKAAKDAAKTAVKVKAAQKAAHKAARKAADSSGAHVEEKSGGKLKALLLLGVLGALAAFVAKKFSGSSEPQWQSTAPGRPVPPPTTPPAPTDAAGAVGGMVAAEDVAADPFATDVAGGGTPDEAAADAVDGPHTPTTPDAPAEEIDLDKP